MNEAKDEEPRDIRAHLIQADKEKLESVQPGETAGAAIWWQHFVEDNAGQIGRREAQVGIIYWTDSERMPFDLFSYIREASRCFTVARYLAAIAMASSAVELVLNRDRRTRGHVGMRRIGGWATLNNPNLITAGDLGLPVQSLCSDGEQMQSKPPILFVERRNKVAHGDILYMLSSLSDYDPKAEEEALDQIQKSQRFVVDWFNTAPDVQERHIAEHRWPDQ